MLRQGKRHIKCRRQVGKLSEGEISARKDLVERGAEMPGGGGPGVGSRAPSPTRSPDVHQPGWAATCLRGSPPGRSIRGECPVSHIGRAEESARASVKATPGRRLQLVRGFPCRAVLPHTPGVCPESRCWRLAQAAVGGGLSPGATAPPGGRAGRGAPERATGDRGWRECQAGQTYGLSFSPWRRS